MAGIDDQLIWGFNNLVTRAGKQIRLKYFTQTVGSVYDDDVTLVQSGADLWTSGIVLPIMSAQGTYENLLVEQGELNPWDQRLYVLGSLLFNSGAINCRVGLGSPSEAEFSIIPLGGITAEANSTKIYKKIYLRRLPLGSLVGSG